MTSGDTLEIMSQVRQSLLNTRMTFCDRFCGPIKFKRRDLTDAVEKIAKGDG